MAKFDSDKLREIRKQHGLLGEGFADKIGITRATVSSLESIEKPGKGPRFDHFIKIALFFNLSLNDLVDWEGETPPGENKDNTEE